MKGIITYFILLIFTSSQLFWAQEQTTPEDFDLPDATTEAELSYAVFQIPQQVFTMQTVSERYVFDAGQLTKYEYKDKPRQEITETYIYKNDTLKSKEVLRGGTMGMEYTTFKYRTEKEGNRIISYKIQPTGEVEKNLEFYNDAGELRGKSFYNAEGKRTKQIEYGGKEGHRIKKYDGDQILSDIIYLYDEHQRTQVVLRYTVPGNEAEAIVRQEFDYNDKGDAIRMREYLPAIGNEEPELSKIYFTDYLYDGDVWVARMEYSSASRIPGKLKLTARSLVTPQQVYRWQNEQQLLDFSEEVYQKCLKLKSN